ncbi:sugar diacid recognition domain-containing protein [Nocardioides albus]|uniref:Carbohydrate diacid regulator n=1 Tax=Nocardioides albus TaxID=1841 RepID=A0A7W5A852_9ACTN|nr:sugar diacid recognition domain-containing protein [Nocardioides albus]MBB3091342.1 carbohydrate diacid regulator [Nocardioides albus]GGU39860.1 CdaR family transcriptional regulator [Nocardioides albus]
MGTAHLTPELAHQVVERTMGVIGHNVNVMDAAGVILASGQDDRIGTVHEGALLAAQQDRVVEIAHSDALALRGVQPGINLPLRCHGQLVGVVGITGEPGQVRVLGDLIRVTAELMVDQAQAAESRQWRYREREEFVGHAAAGRLAPRELAEWAAGLGIDLEVPRRATVVAPTARSKPDIEALRGLQRDLMQVRGVLVGRVEPQELVVFSPAGRSRGPNEEVTALLRAAEGRLRHATGRAFAGRSAFEHAYLTARDALAVTDLVGAGGAAYDFEDVPLLALVRGMGEGWRGDLLAEPWQRLVATDRSGELVATFNAYIEHHASATAAAGALHVHRNTVRYRLSRIGEITGLRMDHLPDVLILYLGPVLGSAR